MSTNDLLASIAGITETSEAARPESVEDEDDEICYDDPELLDSFDSPKEEEMATTSRSRARINIRELQSLAFRGAGIETSRYMPDSAALISTNRARRQHTEKQADLREEPIHHDKTGKLSCTTKGQTETFDLCDCLNPRCDGCHWPCQNCSSRKCLIQCRQNRKEMIAKIEEMYTPEGNLEHESSTNPYYPIPIRD
ncbi:unnamed protein product [Caenorhabditis brenneri]